VPDESAVKQTVARIAGPGRGRRLVGAAAIAMLALNLGGCSSLSSSLGDVSKLSPTNWFSSDSDTEVDEPADRLYNEGLYYLNERHDPVKAIKRFDEVDRQHPYSDWARKALLMSAYANYQAGNYGDCIANAKRYMTLHPASKDVAYANYLMAASYYDQILDVTRDQAQTQRAVAALEEIVRRYPNTEYAAKAKQKLLFARDQLAGKQMEIGRYYLKRHDYTGAINRFKIVVTKYQTTRQVEEALERLTEAYMALGIVNEAQTAAAVLGHNFPNSSWYKRAYTLVKSRGVLPKEDTGSWISKAFRKVGLDVNLG
jgi:outer membrane protein assembly factor BamD